MSKTIRRILSGLIGGLVLVLVLIFFLVQGKVESSEQLKNVQGQASIQEIVQNSQADTSLTSEGLELKMSLTSQQFMTLMKASASGENSSMLDSSIQLEKEHLRVQQPVKLAFLDSKLDVQFTTEVQGDQLRLQIASAKLGNLPIPKSFVASQIKEKLQEGGSSVGKVEGNDVVVTLPNIGFKIKNVQVKDSKLELVLTMAVADLQNSFN